jgi:pilus assembly protein Flp/PilA
MRKLLSWAITFVRGEEGPTAVEYAIMLALILIVALGSIALLGSNSSNTFKATASRGS